MFMRLPKEKNCFQKKMEKQNSGKKATRIKIVSMGDAEVGKSCIIKRYCEKRFVNKYLATIGIDYGVTKVHVEEKEVKVNIFDMAGHPIFYEVRNEFYKDTQGVLLVFDVTCQQSFDSLQLWLNEMKKEIGDPTDMDKIVFVVCANKSDKKRIVDENESRIWANNCGFHYFETSAQNGDGVNKMFETLFEEVIKMIENGGKPQRVTTTLGYTKEQSSAIQMLINGKDNYERIGLHYGASREDVNRAYKKLAMLIHPDKSIAPGTEEAFKVLVDTKKALLK